MKIFVTSDIHGNYNIINKLIKSYENSDAELLLVCGDIGGKNYRASTTNEFGKQQMEDYNFLIGELKKCSKPFRCILGNDDWFDVNDQYCLKTGETIGKVIAFDFVLITPFNTNREVNENKIAYELGKINIDGNSVILAHCPPYGSLDKIYSGEHVGSKSIKNFIETLQPKIWFCGHIHENYGISQIDKTLVINCACNHLKGILKGYIVDINNLEYSCIEL